jgi:replicative DNA helicase
MKVEPLGWGKYYGITVDGDSRYCHSNYIALRNTGKQGAVDFQIMIGRSNDFNSESLRGIGVVKNKLRVPGQPGDPRAEVFFDGNGARYMDAD